MGGNIMASPISPGVYTTITDLSNYVGAVPSTIGLICGLTKKGEDNVLKFIGGRAELISEYGEPNITEYGKNFGQGLYCAYNYLGESGSLYFIRCMPENASFSNVKINVDMTDLDSTATVSLEYIPSSDINSKLEIRTALAATGTTFPLCVLYPIGRGEYYNGLSVRITAHANPMLDGIYVLDIYEKQDDGSEVIVESFEVSFDPSIRDSTGDSIWIQYILNNYSSVLRCEMTTDGDEILSPGYEALIRVYDKEIGTVSIEVAASSATLTDIKQDFNDWTSTSFPYTYCVELTDQRGNKLTGWLGAMDSDDDTIKVYNDRVSGGAQNWIGNTALFDDTDEITYVIKKAFTSVATAFITAEPTPLKKGSDGSLLDASGDLNTSNPGGATDLLSQGYSGILTSPNDPVDSVDELLDQENIYYSIVFDCGYPSDVKTAISTLVTTRRDCVAIMDNGDNSSFNNAMDVRTNQNVFNNYFCAIYEEYNKVYDIFTGQDIWVSPVYHMSYLLPRNDNVAEIWFAAAGFNRGSIDTIKELRFNPRLGQRDQMYLKQLNPIVKFNPGYVNWGQLTSQSKPSALQDLNIVRLVLYCKRALEQYCRYFIFEQNDHITWGQVSGGIVSFLDDIQTRRGLYSFSVEVGATDYEKKTKTFHVNITLEPTRVAEKISLNFFIK
jgi:hypothetical protein